MSRQRGAIAPPQTFDGLKFVRKSSFVGDFLSKKAKFETEKKIAGKFKGKMKI